MGEVKIHGCSMADQSQFMLSRVAELLMWMSRYMERADSLARIVEVIDQLSLDFHHASLTSEQAFWDPLLEAYSITNEGKEISYLEKVYQLTLDRSRLTSVASCVAAARYNAKGIRDQLQNEVWELINELFIWCTEQQKRGIEKLNLSEFGSKTQKTP